MKMPFMRYITWYLAIMMFIIGIAPKVDAGLAPSEIIALTEADRTADLGKIQKVLEIKAVTERLAQLGLTQDEIQKRLNQLSDQQIHQFALQFDELKVGGDGLGVVIVLLVIVILVILIIQLTGHRVIVTK